MHTQAPTSPPLQDWTVLSLRPRGQHGSLRAAAARQGARLLALSPFAIDALADAATRNALRVALQAHLVLYTSPNAVAAAAALQDLRPRRGQRTYAVGAGTRRALQRHGIEAHAPTRMDSEGLLALPGLLDVAGKRIALVTGQGGRNQIAPALRTRGADIQRVDVYVRRPLGPSPQALQRLDATLAAPATMLLAVSSGEALQQLLATLPKSMRTRLARVAVVAASARLGALAREAGFRRIAIADDARPASLLRAAVAAFA